MRVSWMVVAAIGAAMVLAPAGVWGEGIEVRMEGVGEGMNQRFRLAYVQPRVRLSGERPGTLRVLPAGVKHPEFAVLPVGSRELGRVFHVVTDADEAEGRRKRIWVDTNGDGDMTNDPAVRKWEAQEGTYKGIAQHWYEGEGKVDLGPTGKGFVATFGLNTGDPKQVGASEEDRHELVYWCDYGRAGKVEIGGTVYQAAVLDNLATGDFTGQTRPQAVYKEVLRGYFCVDRNGNGRFDGSGETFDVRAPFNIGGVTYEIREMTPSGDFFRIVKSEKTVAELPVPADVAVGKVVPGFAVAGLSGGMVKVPGDFKGKLVLLDFWATWCGPCMAEVPNLRGVYEKYHEKGLEVVGFCQNEGAEKQKVIDTVKKERMDWVQAFDGEGDESTVLRRWGIGGIPNIMLVDGETGVVLATGLREGRIGEVVEGEMRKRGMIP